MPTKSGSIVYMEDGSNAYQTFSANGLDQNSILPTEIQSRYAQTIQTHSGATVAPSATSAGSYASSWVDFDGFSDYSFNSMLDASVGQEITIDWSSDGVTAQGYEKFTSTAQARFSFDSKPKLRYGRVFIKNNDTNPRTANGFLYLKA